MHMAYHDTHQHQKVYNIDINILYGDINVISIGMLWCFRMPPNTSFSPTADLAPLFPLFNTSKSDTNTHTNTRTHTHTHIQTHRQTWSVAQLWQHDISCQASHRHDRLYISGTILPAQRKADWWPNHVTWEMAQSDDLCHTVHATLTATRLDLVSITVDELCADCSVTKHSVNFAN